MSGLDSLLDHLRRAYAAIGEVENVAARVPGDRFVLANLASLKRDAAQIEGRWEEECIASQIEVCRYRLQPEHNERLTLAAVTKSLSDFQELFSQIYDSLKNGTKKRARLSGDMIDETAFDFGFSYPGSLGVALMLPSNRDLFSGKFEGSVDAFMQIMQVSNEYEVRDLAKNLGDAVVKKTFDWSKTNYFSGYGVDVTWNTVRGTKKGGLIDIRSLGRIVEIIGRTSDTEIRDFRPRGTLVGIDTLKKRFRFVEPDGLDYAGSLNPEFPVDRKWTVNTAYTAHIRVRTTTEYATQETKNLYELVSLTPIDIPK